MQECWHWNPLGEQYVKLNTGISIFTVMCERLAGGILLEHTGKAEWEAWHINLLTGQCRRDDTKAHCLNCGKVDTEAHRQSNVGKLALKSSSWTL